MYFQQTEKVVSHAEKKFICCLSFYCVGVKAMAPTWFQAILEKSLKMCHFGMTYKYTIVCQTFIAFRKLFWRRKLITSLTFSCWYRTMSGCTNFLLFLSVNEQSFSLWANLTYNWKSRSRIPTTIQRLWCCFKFKTTTQNGILNCQMLRLALSESCFKQLVLVIGKRGAEAWSWKIADCCALSNSQPFNTGIHAGLENDECTRNALLFEAVAVDLMDYRH